MLKTKSVVKRLSVVAAVAVLAACGGGGGGDNFDGGSGVGGDPQDQPFSAAPAMVQEYAALVNNARSQARQCGATAVPASPPLTKWNPRLQDAAQAHANDMDAKGYFSHTGSDGSTYYERASRHGYQGWTVTEVLMRGSPSTTPKTHLDVWLQSPGHCMGLMSSESTTVAVARNGRYTVMMFGK